ncbi:MAG: RluA family pseudouridine synthase [Deltaproteobacteria bacterium]|nr:RluA family pseudouridine synthase [Deltaproteobacteria bacterium]
MDKSAPHRVLNIRDRAAGRRADVFLALRFPDWSRSAFARFIRDGLVQSDERALKPASTLRHGETLRVYVHGLAPSSLPPSMPPVLYEDEWLIAVNKPPGLLMHPVGQRFAWALVGLVREARPEAHIDLSHRLDKDTSGVVLLTKHEDANRHMKACFMRRRVSKVYLAITRGQPPWDEFDLHAPLGHAPGSTVLLRRGHDPAGESAHTRFVVSRRMATHALVECHPTTGRTHQIRAHLEHLGFPILGDKLYGQPDTVFLELLEAGVTDAVRAAVGFPRQALHAHQICFPHPATGQMLRVTAPLAPDMQAIVEGAAPSYPNEASTEASDE